VGLPCFMYSTWINVILKALKDPIDFILKCDIAMFQQTFKFIRSIVALHVLSFNLLHVMNTFDNGIRLVSLAFLFFY